MMGPANILGAVVPRGKLTCLCVYVALNDSRGGDLVPFEAADSRPGPGRLPPA